MLLLFLDNMDLVLFEDVVGHFVSVKYEIDSKVKSSIKICVNPNYVKVVFHQRVKLGDIFPF